jgi:hypothetical protein
MVCGAERTFLVECYVSELDEATAGDISSRVRATVSQLRNEGLAMRWLRSFALVDEETYVCIVRAGDLDQIARLKERAGLSAAHVVEVVAIEPR